MARSCSIVLYPRESCVSRVLQMPKGLLGVFLFRGKELDLGGVSTGADHI